jgi:hypothetical protein
VSENIPSYQWTTGDEMRFVRNLGRGAFVDSRIKPSVPRLEQRLALLQKYRDAMRLRYWNGLNKAQVERVVKEEIDAVLRIVRNGYQP